MCIMQNLSPGRQKFDSILEKQQAIGDHVEMVCNHIPLLEGPAALACLGDRHLLLNAADAHNVNVAASLIDCCLGTSSQVVLVCLLHQGKVSC